MGGGSKTSVKAITFLFVGTIILIIKMMQLRPSSSKIPLKPISLKLNIRPYNKSDKEVIDFKECKGRLTMPYNTKCFYLGARILQE